MTVVSDCHFHLDNQSRSHYKSKDHTKSDKDVDKISCTMVLLSLLPFLGTSISKLDHKWFNATYRLTGKAYYVAEESSLSQCIWNLLHW